LTKEGFETCETCLPFKTAKDFQYYISRKEYEKKLADAIRKDGAISVVGFGGTGKSTLVNKVLIDLEEYQRINVDLRHASYLVVKNPHKAMEYVLETIVKGLTQKKALGSYLKTAIKFAKSLSVSFAGLLEVSIGDLINAMREDKEFENYVDTIGSLLTNQLRTSIVVLDDLVDIMQKNFRGFLIALVEVLQGSLDNKRIKSLIIARETKTRGRRVLLGKDEILELEDNFSCIRIRGFDRLQVKKFVTEIMGLKVENDKVIDVLYRKTQGRPRVLCYALTSFRKKYGKNLISAADSSDERKFPSTPKHQLNNYLNEVYGNYRTELIAASVLRNFSRDELAYLCLRIGKNLTDDDFISFRNSGVVEERDIGIFAIKDTYLPLMIDVFESLLDDRERHRYNKLMANFHTDNIAYARGVKKRRLRLPDIAIPRDRRLSKQDIIRSVVLRSFYRNEDDFIRARLLIDCFEQENISLSIILGTSESKLLAEARKRGILIGRSQLRSLKQKVAAAELYVLQSHDESIDPRLFSHELEQEQ